MSYRIHPSARPIQLSKLWMLPHKFYDNPFLLHNSNYHNYKYQVKHQGDHFPREIDPDSHHLNTLGEIVIKPTKFQLMLDMIHFKPEEISIRAVHNGFYVKAAHKERVDNKDYITHHFYREYILPHDIYPDQTQSWMTVDNILHIEAPKVEFDPVILDENTQGIEVEIIRRS